MQIQLDQKKKMVLLHVISGASLYFYFISDKKQAFNNMFCRIWEFLFGNMVFCLERYSQEPKSEKMPLLCEEEPGKEEKIEQDSLDWIFVSLSLALLIYSILTEQHLTENYSRMTTTFVSIVLIYFGKGFSVLKNAPMTTIEDCRMEAMGEENTTGTAQSEMGGQPGTADRTE